MKIMGIDEAGRGCVIGPMVISGIIVSEQGWEELVAIGVKDSKRLSPKRREALFEPIRHIAATVASTVIAPGTIDQYCRQKKLNWLEIEVMAALIRKLQPEVVYIDALGTNMKKFAAQIRGLLDGMEISIIAENHADATYPVVSAASIIAKVTRDAAIAQLHLQYGDFGSGYPADPKTGAFLRQIYQTHRHFPDDVRQSWSTVYRVMADEQNSVFPFLR